jgi:hypothetical protein
MGSAADSNVNDIETKAQTFRYRSYRIEMKPKRFDVFKKKKFKTKAELFHLI